MFILRDFQFGVATSAHQIEGHNENSDWWRWESTPGKIKNGDTSQIATDSWNHLDEDIANLKWLGVDFYRFSVEWAKIEPQEGRFDEAMIDRYVAEIEKLKTAGIEPMVTLYHFTFPQWVAEKGGWDWDGLPKAFERFTVEVVSRIGPRVRMWVTLNEPMTIIAAGYLSDVFPPAKNDLRSIGVPMTHMVQAHALAYHAIHRLLDSPGFRPEVGLAHHLRNFDAFHRLNPLDRYAARKFDQIFNWAIPKQTIGTQDFFGLNYYSRDRVQVRPFGKEMIERRTTPGAPVQDLGWEIYPDGMRRILDRVQALFPGMPIWITENGIADRADTSRASFIRDHLAIVDQEIQNGAPIRGYAYWTLNDNFEWAEGYSAQFGLFSLEPGTLNRIPRSSAYDYRALIEHVKRATPETLSPSEPTAKRGYRRP